MPQVPNRYFNNQALADIGRNLSLAIAGDPERDAARLSQKHTEMLMQREREKATLEAQDRAKQQEALPLFSALMALPEDAIQERRDLGGRIGAIIGPSKTLFDTMGRASPIWDVASERIAKQNEGKINVLTEQQKAINARFDKQDATTQRGQNMRSTDARAASEMRFKIAQLGATTRKQLAELKGKGGTPLDISPEDRQNIYNQVLLLADDLGGELDPELARRIVTRTTELYQDSRNSSTAFDQAVEENLRNPQVVPGKTHWIGKNDPAQIVPGTSAQTSAVVPNGGLSDAFLLNQGAQPSLFGAAPTPQFGPLATPGSAPAQPTFAPRSAAAEQYLRDHPTVELKAAFETKYGYLPSGL